MITLAERLAAVRLVILDIDGVLTDGRLYFTAEGESCKVFDVKDGHGIRMLLHYGLDVAVISGRASEAVAHRMKDLEVEKVYLGFRDKLPVFKKLLQEERLSADQIAYLGDDLPDLPIMTRVNLACATNDAHPEVKKNAHCVLSSRGGQGAVRELSEKILIAQGHWDNIMQHYLGGERHEA